MRIHFVWHDCTLLFDPVDYRTRGDPRKMFWVSATREEALKFLCPLMSNAQRALYDTYQSIPDPEEGERSPHNDDGYFAVSADLIVVSPCMRVFPVSGMWNGDNPWCRFEFEFTRLEQIAFLDTSKVIPANEDPTFDDGYIVHWTGKTNEELLKSLDEEA